MICVNHYGKPECVALEITAQAKRGRLMGMALPRIMGSMTNEQRLLLCVLLQAVAEQSPEYVLSDTSSKKRQRARERMAHEARTFVASSEFEEMAEFVDIPLELLRSLEPFQASRALAILSDPDADIENAARVIDKANVQKVRTKALSAIAA